MGSLPRKRLLPAAENMLALAPGVPAGTGFYAGRTRVILGSIIAGAVEGPAMQFNISETTEDSLFRKPAPTLAGK